MCLSTPKDIVKTNERGTQKKTLLPPPGPNLHLPDQPPQPDPPLTIPFQPPFHLLPDPSHAVQNRHPPRLLLLDTLPRVQQQIKALSPNVRLPIPLQALP